MKKHIVSALLLLAILVPVSASAEQGDVDPDGSASSCVTLKNNLKYRSRDAKTDGEVSDLQDFLQTMGYFNGEPTGYFGQQTLVAVKAFQTAQGIKSTGYVGSLTRARISGVSCTMTNTTTSTTATSSTSGQIGCAPGFPYSPVTGQSCGLEKSFFPDGCYSASGYSSTTGQPCGTLITPQIDLKVNGSDETLSIVNGSSVALSWTGKGSLYSCALESGELGLTGRVTFEKALQNETLNVKYPGLYSIGITCNDGTVSDYVKINVINQVQTWACSSDGYDPRTGLRCGCTSTAGWSSTTGMSCDILSEVPVISYLQLGGCTTNIGSTSESDSCSAAPVGGTVYVFGSNLTADAEIYFGDGRQTATPEFSSIDSTLSFVVPSIPGNRTSISVKVELGGKRYFSNSVWLPLR